METMMQMNVQMRPECVLSFMCTGACREGSWGGGSTWWKSSNLKGGHMDSVGKGAAGHFVCMK